MSGAEFGTPRDLAAAYALGALDAAGGEGVRGASRTRRRAGTRSGRVPGGRGTAGPGRAGLSPTDGLRARVLAGAPPRRSAAAPPTQAGFNWMPWALAAALLLAAWMGAGRARLGARLDEAYALLSRRDTLLAERDTLLEVQQRTLDALLAPGVELYQLTATGDPVPGVQLFWDRKRNRAIIHSFGVKPLPDGPYVSALVHPGWEAGARR